MKISELYTKYTHCGLNICTDTRHIIKDSLFFAIKGDNFDGNEFAEVALSEGAKFVVTSNKILSEKSESYIYCQDTLETLQLLANFHRRQFDIPVIGITGSNGKTTTKELIGTVLNQKYNCLITEDNLNNHLGVPFTLLKLRDHHEVAIIEMGANKPNDIEELCIIAEPTFGIITNIGKAHIEGFGSFEGVLRTKLEMYDYITYTDGTVFINLDQNELVKNAPSSSFISYGTKGQVQSKIIPSDQFLCFEWKFDTYQSPAISTKMIGSYNIHNFTTAAAVGCYFEVNPEQITEALINYQPSNNRSQLEKTEKNEVILDCYNANPTSMYNAIKSLSEMSSANKYAIIGDMKELGNISQKEHVIIFKYIQKLGIACHYVGDEFKSALKNEEIHGSENVKEAIDFIEKLKLTNNTILIKGSRSIQLEKIFEANIL
ncbi:MAG: UDP-N-acetylmuramoyl-tripeptide--D-alanyl-D-alanine ligase [Flavobacteriales bacterium]|jgi:UDP-N-acetylmuramoyl-tripeptide--D-alanyl-D-alanine ligase